MLPLYRFLVQTTDTCAHVIKVYGIFTGMERAWLQGAHEARHEVRKEREKRREERALALGQPSHKRKVVKYDRRTQLGRRRKV